LKVTVLINNISSFPVGPLLDINTRDLDEAYRSTYRSVLLSSKEVVKDMKEMGWGSIINISMAGTNEIKPYRTVAVHASMKTALNIITLSMSSELKDLNINVNAILPGIIDREDGDEKWRVEMKRISPGGELTTIEDVSSEVVKLVMDTDRTGELLEVL
jgi:NAD(P)-dependent dehydrogenase (short-subunit alcohol dehydrogenase family)